MATSYPKLVRDKVPLHLSARGIDFEDDVYDLDADFRAALRQKLVEEAEELAAAHGPTQLAEEMADLLEVLHTLRRLYGIDTETVERVRFAKGTRMGRFEHRVKLISEPTCHTSN